MPEPRYWNNPNLNWTRGWSPKPRIVANSVMNEARDGRVRWHNSPGDVETYELPESLPPSTMAIANAVDGRFDSTFLPQDSYEFNAIVAYLQANARSRIIRAPTGERTRMDKAVTEIKKLVAIPDDVQSQTDKDMLKTYLMTLLEDEATITKEELTHLYTKYNIRIRKHRPPLSGQATVTRIMVIRNKALWDSYDAKREAMINEIEDQRMHGEVHGAGDSTLSFGRVGNSVMSCIPRARINFQAPHDSGLMADSTTQLPVLDKRCGEALLMHGSAEHICRAISGGGFDPVRNKGRPEGSKTLYGALGQGTYFTDLFAKVQTYASCPLCAAVVCNCKDETSQPQERVLILARCLLGNSTRARTHDSHRAQNAETIKPGKHSVVGEAGIFGSGTSMSLFSSNEFLIKDVSQMYPEFIVFWTRD